MFSGYPIRNKDSIWVIYVTELMQTQSESYAKQP